jgi:hypothetical protein
LLRSFDHLVGELLELQRHFETKRLGGLHVDDQLSRFLRGDASRKDLVRIPIVRENY